MSHPDTPGYDPTPPSDYTDSRLATVLALHAAAVGRERVAAYAALEGVRSRTLHQHTVSEITDRLILTAMSDARELDATAAVLAASWPL